MAQQLTLKHRPIRLDQLYGQPTIQQYLKSLLTRGPIARNIIFAGTHGTGKTTSGRVYARALNCTNLQPDGNPCNKCTNCSAHLEERYADYHEQDAATKSGVKDVMQMVEVCNTPPMLGKYRVFLSDECHRYSRQAWDALLKITEEPPPYLVLLFATTEPEAVRPAIRSRCAILNVKLLDQTAAFECLDHVIQAEGLSVDHDAKQLIVNISEGHPRDLLKNLEQATSGTEPGSTTTLRQAATALGLDTNEGIPDLITHAILHQDRTKTIDFVHRWPAAPTQIQAILVDYITMLLLEQQGVSIISHNPNLITIPAKTTAYLANQLSAKNIQVRLESVLDKLTTLRVPTKLSLALAMTEIKEVVSADGSIGGSERAARVSNTINAARNLNRNANLMQPEAQRAAIAPVSILKTPEGFSSASS